MRLLQSINEWNKGRVEKKNSAMQAQGKCPTCYGRGIDYPLGFHDFYYPSVTDCPGCNGSGLYSDWAKMNGSSNLT